MSDGEAKNDKKSNDIELDLANSSFVAVLLRRIDPR